MRKIVKRVSNITGSIFITIIILGLIIFSLRSIFFKPAVSAFILIGCPFIAYYLKSENANSDLKELSLRLFGVLLLCAFCGFSILFEYNKIITYVESHFLNGKKKQQQVWVEEYESDDNGYSKAEHTPGHYENQSYFVADSGQSEWVASLISWSVFFAAIEFPIIVYLMVKSNLIESS